MISAKDLASTQGISISCSPSELQPNSSSNQHELVQAGSSLEATPEESRWCPPWVFCDINVQFRGHFWEIFQKDVVISNEILMQTSPLEAPPYGAWTSVCPAEVGQCDRTLVQLCRGGHSVPSQWHTLWLHHHAGSQLLCVAWVSSLGQALPVPAGTIWQSCSSGGCVLEEGVIQ